MNTKDGAEHQQPCQGHYACLRHRVVVIEPGSIRTPQGQISVDKLRATSLNGLHAARAGVPPARSFDRWDRRRQWHRRPTI
ncbi:hypothetical protein [Streptomyces sp. NPDC058739]|uniref:hypothetical protein n=1 Tax=Streptomyces sp. NPDC058739 TaxID=3346618 RepID=UPI0036CEDDC6